ncbi:MAG TPA: hypothetical protein VFH43_03950 [Candidatus Kapabacteria bacterium]|jgi:hypothetical protein|nr:hypothetical protein [Candidatus Kapabacteria bacterium]
MLRKKTVLSVAMLAAFTLTLASCSNKATEEQMKTLRALDSERDGLRAELERNQSALRDAKGKLTTQDRDLKDCNDDTQFARAELVNWPNVWADSLDWKVAERPMPAKNTGGAPRNSTK